jgi:quercetin dioxygenase-like cupin family protein
VSDGVRIIRAGDGEVRDRGAGVRTRHLVTAESGDTVFATGTTEFAAGAALGLHFHDCSESVLVLEGEARFDHGDGSDAMGAGDTTFVPAGVPHRFVNVGDGVLRLYFVYGSAMPTRTMVATGETFPIGSQQDVVS